MGYEEKNATGEKVYYGPVLLTNISAATRFRFFLRRVWSYQLQPRIAFLVPPQSR